MNKPRTGNLISLFGMTFVSAFLLFFGLGMMALTFAPALASLLPGDSSNFSNYTLLPPSLDREEGFIDVGSFAGKQMFPALPEVQTVEKGDWISIPSIGVNVPLALSPTIEDKDIISTLEKGAALYPNGINPGRLGNTFIAAHSTGNPWHGAYRFAFLKINEVKAGNYIHLDYQGTRYTYTVTKSDIVKPSSDFKIASDRPVPTVTLMACWPLWSTSNRMLVHAELTNVTQLTSQPK